MFDNIGVKIMTVAITITFLGIFLSIISGVILMLDGDFGGLLIMIFGSLISWIGSFLLYGFGQLIDNSDRLVELLEGTNPDDGSSVTPRYSPAYRPLNDGAAPVYHPSIDEPLYPPVSSSDWVCFSCGSTNFRRVETCQTCGVTKHWSEAKHAKAAGTAKQ